MSYIAMLAVEDSYQIKRIFKILEESENFEYLVNKYNSQGEYGRVDDEESEINGEFCFIFQGSYSVDLWIYKKEYYENALERDKNKTSFMEFQHMSEEDMIYYEEEMKNRKVLKKM